MADHLDRSAGEQVHRLDTEGRAPGELAERVLDLAGWVGSGTGRPID
ncbi:hypothetical protein ACF3NT_10990 [Naumannella halotolerans]